MEENLPALPSHAGMPLTSEDVQRVKEQRAQLMEFVRSQLKEGIDNDFAVIPGCKKNSLLKPGAEKLQRLFGLGARIIYKDKHIDAKENFAMFTYRYQVFHLATGNNISECEGVANSREKKWATRTEWYKNPDNPTGPKLCKEVPTPIFDILNTLSKMAQKRALVGATIAAVGGSDIFTQDLEDNTPKSPNTPRKTNDDDATRDLPDPPLCCGKKMMLSKYPDKDFDGQKPWYCFGCKNKKVVE